MSDHPRTPNNTRILQQHLVVECERCGGGKLVVLTMGGVIACLECRGVGWRRPKMTHK